MDVCAVVVTYNRKELLEQCIRALLSQETPLTTVIIMDNATTDGTELLFEKPEFTRGNTLVRYIRMEKNLGGSGGFHYGFEEAVKTQCDWLLVLDDDAILEPDFCTRMLEAAEVYPQTECFTGNVKWFTNGRWRLTRETTDTYSEVERVTFVGAMIRRSLVERIGLPERDFFIWYDDTEYSMRMRMHTNIICVNGAVAVHMQKEEINVGLSWKKFYGMRNYVIVRLKYTKGPLKHLKKCLFVCVYTIRFLAACVVKQLLLEHSIRKFRVKLVLGMTAIVHGVKNIQGVHPLYMPGRPIGGVYDETKS